MRTETRQLTVGENDHGVRLDVFLTLRYGDFSRTEWQERIDGKFIKVNGLIPRSSRRLNAGDVVEFSYTFRDEPETPTEIPVLFEDENYLVVNKPAGLPVHPSGIYRTQTVATLLVERKILSEGYLVHRLDRETSGVLILGKSRAAAAAFQKTLHAGTIDKQYLVIVEGQFPAFLDAAGFLYRMPGSHLPRQRFFSEKAPPPGAMEIQTSRTHLTRQEQHGDITLVQAKLFTGRMHQIRATLHSLGYPVVGDKLYGVDAELYFKFVDDQMTDADWRRLRLERCALHCASMDMVHPLTHTAWSLNAPLPADMQKILSL